MSGGILPNEMIDRLNDLLVDLDLNFEEQKKIAKRNIIHSYIEDFKNFDTENIQQLGDRPWIQ